MSATIVWNINSLLCKKQEDGETDVVYQVAYSCVATQKQGETEYTQIINSVVEIPFTGGGNFIPYDQLTKNEVLQWVWSNGVDKDKTEASLQTLIDKQINSNDVSPPLPW